MNGIRDTMNFTPYLINVATLPCESQNTENVILQRDITKANCIRCIIASVKWISVIMCLKFTDMGCYTAKPAWSKRFVISMTCENAWCKLILTFTRTEHHLRSCVHAGGGHFEHMLWHECSLYDSPEHFMKLPMYFDAWNGYFVVNIKSWSCLHMHFRFLDFHKVV